MTWTITPFLTWFLNLQTCNTLTESVIIIFRPFLELKQSFSQDIQVSIHQHYGRCQPSPPQNRWLQISRNGRIQNINLKAFACSLWLKGCMDIAHLIATVNQFRTAYKLAAPYESLVVGLLCFSLVLQVISSILLMVEKMSEPLSYNKRKK